MKLFLKHVNMPKSWDIICNLKIIFVRGVQVQSGTDDGNCPTAKLEKSEQIVRKEQKREK